MSDLAYEHRFPTQILMATVGSRAAEAAGGLPILICPAGKKLARKESRGQTILIFS